MRHQANTINDPRSAATITVATC